MIARLSPAFGRRDPDARGYYGSYGGRFVPETLVAPVAELEAAYLEARSDQSFRDELDGLLRHYVGRPTPLFEARRLAEEPVTLEELSSEFDISRERVRQIEVRAFEKVQEAVQKEALEAARALRVVDA